MAKYECDCCGACCQGTLLVEAFQLDVLREPRLVESDPRTAGRSLDAVLAELDEEDRCLLIAGGASRPCAFLDGENRCAVYPTRPNGCVAMPAGSEECQLARGRTGLPPLEPVAT